MSMFDLPFILGTRTGFPVPFLRKPSVLGIAAPLGAPMVAPLAMWEWEPPSRLYFPERLAHWGLEVVPKPKVEAVGWSLPGNCDL